MKHATFAAVLALAPSVAAFSVPAVARSGNEVPLHIEAVGEVAPDTATMIATQQAQGASQVVANSALDRQHDELVKRLGELGVATRDIVWTRDEVAGDSMVDMMTTETGSPSEPAFYANASATITLHDATKLASVMAAMSAMPLPPTVSPRSIRLSVSDERAARGQAIQRGFAKARQDAESYAAAAQMKIARVERISNARAPVSALDMQQFFSKIVGMVDDKSFGRDSFNGVAVSVVVDYVLTP